MNTLTYHTKLNGIKVIESKHNNSHNRKNRKTGNFIPEIQIKERPVSALIQKMMSKCWCISRSSTWSRSIKSVNEKYGLFSMFNSIHNLKKIFKTNFAFSSLVEQFAAEKLSCYVQYSSNIFCENREKPKQQNTTAFINQSAYFTETVNGSTIN